MIARIAASGSAAWYLTDRLGSVRDITDNTGAVIDHVNYDGFGNVTSETQATNGDRFKWTGRELDTETGLQYNRARYYDPKAGRWISQDPIGLSSDDANLYRYVSNDAPNSIDPGGLVDGPPPQAQMGILDKMKEVMRFRYEQERANQLQKIDAQRALKSILQQDLKRREEIEQAIEKAAQEEIQKMGKQMSGYQVKREIERQYEEVLAQKKRIQAEMDAQLEKWKVEAKKLEAAAAARKAQQEAQRAIMKKRGDQIIRQYKLYQWEYPMNWSSEVYNQMVQGYIADYGYYEFYMLNVEEHMSDRPEWPNNEPHIEDDREIP